MFNNVTGQETFETLLARRNKMIQDAKPTKKFENRNQINITKAEKGADLNDFISMIAKVMSKALKKHNAVFIPDEGGIIKDPHKTLEQPTILYKIVERKPTLELKPRPTEEVVEDNDSDTNRRFGTIYTQKQSCVVQFDVVASDYISANSVMNTFEEAMFTYTGYFKSQGVAEMYFLKHFTDKNLDNYRQDLSVRSLQYHVQIQKIITVFDTTIDDVTFSERN